MHRIGKVVLCTAFGSIAALGAMSGVQAAPQEKVQQDQDPAAYDNTEPADSKTTAAKEKTASADRTQNIVLEPIVVTASRIPEPITEAKADISIVSREQIEKMHMATVEEALRTVPGVQFLNYGANGLNANLSGLRINGSKDIVVLVDGVRINDFQGANNSGYMYASQLSNMDNIERIEVLRGSAGTVYGSGARGGVINIITREIEENKTTVDLSAGGFGKTSYKANTQGKHDALAWNVYYNKNANGDTKDGSGKTWKGHNDMENVGVKFVYDLSKTQKITASYDSTKASYSGTDFIYNNDYDGDYSSKAFTLRHDWKISPQWTHMLTYRKSDIRGTYGQLYHNAQAPYHFKRDNSYEFLSEQLRYELPHNDLIFGVDYSKGTDNALRPIGWDPDTGDRLYGHKSMRNFSYYIQDTWEFVPHVYLTGGLRYDRPSGDVGAKRAQIGSHTSKSYKLSWDITDRDTIYMGRSDFYILPSIEQLTDPQYGNGDLLPAEGRTTSVGYNRTFKDHSILTVNWFTTKSARTIGYSSSGQYQNYDNAVARGWNAQYITQWGKHWTGHVGWAHLFWDANGDNFAMGYYPKDELTFGVSYSYAKVNAGLEGFYFMRQVNPMYADQKGWPADNYGVYNLSVNYSPEKDMTFYLKVDNIFDKLYAEHTNVIHMGGRPGQWYSMPGRSLVIGMQMRF